MGYELVCVHGPMKDRRWNLTSDGLKIGRAESCDIRIEDVSVELFHCVVKLDDGKPVVLNLASDKGVNVNGIRVSEAHLKAADVICVGSDWFAAESVGGDKGGSGARIAGIAAAILLLFAAASFALWRRGQVNPPVAPSPIPTNAVAHVQAAITTNHVVRTIGKEVVVTNRIVHVVGNVVVTNYVVEVKPVDKTSTVVESQGDNVMKTDGDNGDVAPDAADGLGFSDDGKTLVSVPQGIVHVVIPNGVTTIDDRVFENHKALESVAIPPSVEKIGRNVFNGCSKLTGIKITDLAAWCQLSFGVNQNPLEVAHNLYLNGLLVNEMHIPQGVSSIHENAFRGCASLTRVVIHGDVKEIRTGAFADCGNLAKFEVDRANRHYKSVDGLVLTKDGRTLVAVPAGLKTVAIPAGVVTIGDKAFLGCRNLTRMVIPDGVTRIGSGAFAYCSGLLDLTVPPSVAKIGGWAFHDCNSLVNIYISDLTAWCRMAVAEPLSNMSNLYLNGNLVKDMKIPIDVARIEKFAFRGCGSLTCVTIPQGVKHVGEGAFTDCSNLTEFRVAGGNYQYKDDRGLLMTRDGKILIAVPGGMSSVEIPGGTEEIAVLAFGGCNRLVDVKIPNCVTRICYRAFADCKGLVRVDIPNSVKSIENLAFGNCRQLESVTIPEGLTDIHERAFEGCKLLLDAQGKPRLNIRTSDLKNKHTR